MLKIIYFIIIFIFGLSAVASEPTQSVEPKPVEKKVSAKGLRVDKNIGIALYGTSSVGTNIIEYNLTSQIAFGLGLGVEQSYYPSTIDKIKLSTKYYFFERSFSPFAGGGFIFKEKIAKIESINFPYFAAGTQYLAKNGLGITLELDYYRLSRGNHFKPAFTVHWFF